MDKPENILFLIAKTKRSIPVELENHFTFQMKPAVNSPIVQKCINLRQEN